MRTVIKKERVRVSDDVARLASSDVRPETADTARSSQPGVRLIRVDGRIDALEVTCRCGDVAVVEVEYDQDVQSETTS